MGLGSLPRRRFRSALGAVVLATATFAAWLSWSVGGKASVLYVSDVGQGAAALVATLACVRAGARQEQQQRVFWWLLAGSCGAWMAGQVVWTVYDIVGSGPPIPSWADVGFLTFIPLAVGALLCHPGLRGGGTRAARSLLDGLAIGGALFFLSWTSVLGPLWRSSDLTTLGGVVTFAYPFGDVVLVFFVVLTVRRMRAVQWVELWCLLAGLLGLAFSDSTYAYVVNVHRYASGEVLDVGWFAGFLTIALGAVAADTRELLVRSEFSSPALSPALSSLMAPLVPMLIALSATGISINLGYRPDGVALGMAFLLVVLALARQMLLVLDFIAVGRNGKHEDAVDRLTDAALGYRFSRDHELEPPPLRQPDGCV